MVGGALPAMAIVFDLNRVYGGLVAPAAGEAAVHHSHEYLLRVMVDGRPGQRAVILCHRFLVAQ